MSTGYQATLKEKPAGSGVYTTVSDLVMVKVPDVNVKPVEYLPLAEIATRRDPGSLDNGPMSFDIYFAATHAGSMYATLHGYATGRSLRDWQITAPPGDAGKTQFSFRGFISKLGSLEKAHDNKMKVTCEVAVDGAITIAAAV